MKFDSWQKMAGLVNETPDERANNVFKKAVRTVLNETAKSMNSGDSCPDCGSKMNKVGDCSECGGMFEEGYDDWKTRIPDEDSDGPDDACPICGEKAGKKCKCDGEDLDEVAPPGWEGTVKAMKKHKDIKNPWALAWSMKNKGEKSHVKEASASVWPEGMGDGPLCDEDDELMPESFGDEHLDDYEQCSDCGYDHEYETEEANRWHMKHGAPNVGITPEDMKHPDRKEAKLHGHECLVCGGTPDQCEDAGCYGDMFPHDDMPDDACPGCGNRPGDGVNPVCHDPNGCGHWKEEEKRYKGIKSEGMKDSLDRILGLDKKDEMNEAEVEPTTMRNPGPSTQRSPASGTMKKAQAPGKTAISGPASKRFFKQIDQLVDSWEEDQLAKGRNKVSATKAATSLHTLIANAMDKFENALGESRKSRRK